MRSLRWMLAATLVLVLARAAWALPTYETWTGESTGESETKVYYARPGALKQKIHTSLSRPTCVLRWCAAQ